MGQLVERCGVSSTKLEEVGNVGSLCCAARGEGSNKVVLCEDVSADLSSARMCLLSDKTMDAGQAGQMIRGR